MNTVISGSLVLSALTTFITLISVPGAEAQPGDLSVLDGLNCPRAGYMYPSEDNLCYVMYCLDANTRAIKRPCARGTRVPSWWSGGELNMCFVPNIAKHGGDPICLRCDAHDLPPASVRCASNPCPRECTCEDTEYTFRCDCPPTGVIVPINGAEPFPDDHCEPNPCENGASCQNQWDGFFCFCPNGWTGHRCEQSVCDWHPCLNGGTCVIDEVGYHCECSDCWSGSCCNVTVPDCRPTINRPCVQCRTGALCETVVDSCECQQSDCPDGMQCVDVNGQTECSLAECDEPTCYVKGCTIRLDNCDCTERPCPPNSRCEDSGDKTSHECKCDACYKAPDCIEKTNTCDCSNPCPLNSNCQDTTTGPHCICDECSKGDRCDQSITSCLCNSPCSENELCRLVDDVPECYCENDCFFGAGCSNLRNTCECANPCGQLNTCTMKNGLPTCSCSDACKTGPNCDQDVMSCDCTRPCVGPLEQCVEGNPPTCTCSDSCKFGPGCDETLNTCECMNPSCTSGRECTMVDGIPTCGECAESCRTGENCEELVDTCQCNNRCSASQDCYEENGATACRCKNECMTGVNCDEVKDTCVCRPCEAGTCRDTNTGRNCDCSQCHEGELCERINSCECSNPCEDEDSCVDGASGPSCGCSDSCFRGLFCAERINNCECDNPCNTDNQECYMDENNRPACRCLDSCKSGSDCDQDVNDCRCVSGNFCPDGQTCLDTSTGPECVCEDLRCSEGPSCDRKNTCDCSNPCPAEQRCRDSPNGPECSCPDSCFTGSTCSVRVESCDCITCNVGICDDSSGTAECRCPDCYAGPRCEQRLDPCECNSPCNDDQTCYVENGEAKCRCKDCRTGENCGETINTCLCNDPCQGRAECINSVNGPACGTCSDSCYSGPLCEDRKRTCSCNNPCGVDQDCRDVAGVAQCFCRDECLEGPGCSQTKDTCNCRDPCGDHGNCRDTESGTRCDCDACWMGNACDQQINSCGCGGCDADQPCRDTEQGPDCGCSSCYTGDTCQTRINSCECSNPCSLATSCDNTPEGPVCSCNCVDDEVCVEQTVGSSECRCPQCYRNRLGERGCQTRVTNLCECAEDDPCGADTVCVDNDDPAGSYRCTTGNPSSGSSFTVMFEENNTEKPYRIPLELYFSSAIWNDGPRQVRVRTPGLPTNHHCYNDETVTVGEGTVYRYPVDRCMQHNRTGLAQLAIHVREISNRSITVYGINTERWSSDGFLAIPDEKAGTHYQTVSYSPAHIATQFGIVALEDDTIVTMQLADDNNLPEGYNTSGSQYSQAMRAWDTFQVQSRCPKAVTLDDECLRDLTGSVIRSNKPIHVFSGNVRSWVPDKSGLSRDHLIEQLFSVDKWGLDFAIVTVPNRVIGDIIQIMAQNGVKTKCMFYMRYGDQIYADEPENGAAIPSEIDLPTPKGKYHINKDIPSGGMYRLQCSHPVYLTQITKSLDQIYRYFNESVHDPVIMTVPPISQFTNNFFLNTPQFTGGENFETQPYNTTYALLVATAEHRDTITLNGALLTEFVVPWTRIPHSNDNKDVSLMGCVVLISDGTNIIRNSEQRNFQCLVYGHDNRESYGFPAGMALSKFKPT